MRPQKYSSDRERSIESLLIRRSIRSAVTLESSRASLRRENWFKIAREWPSLGRSPTMTDYGFRKSGGCLALIMDGSNRGLTFTAALPLVMGHGSTDHRASLLNVAKLLI
jgi:hypothetical protein